MFLWDAGCDAVIGRVQIASTTSNWRRDGRRRMNRAIVGGFVLVALMKCRTKAAAYRTEAVGRRGEGRR